MPSVTPVITPGKTIGILGSGQLGRMLALAAKSMGYKVAIYSPESHSPAGQVADVEMSGSYHDKDALLRFVQGVDVLTFEFENVPVETLHQLETRVHTAPGSSVLYLSQNRQREKGFLAQHGFPVTPFAPVFTLEGLEAALETIGFPAILKTADQGYDGKGQVKITSLDEATAAFHHLEGKPCVLEACVDFQAELSVIVARAANGEMVHYGPIENQHLNHVLDVSIAPGRFDPTINQEAVRIAHAVAEQAECIGLLCIEFFLTRDNNLLINELAPRPHNSGHYTLDACVTSQFEQHIRAVCGLPLGSVYQHTPAVMANLLGDLWEGGAPNWQAALSYDGIKLHLYGKREARVGRKMGHLTAIGPNTDVALNQVLSARNALLSGVEEKPALHRLSGSLSLR